jgi:hypothetical protein
MDELRHYHRRERDHFPERTRGDPQEAKEKSKEAARDPLWRTAFEKAARQEAAQKRDRGRAKDQDRVL